MDLNCFTRVQTPGYCRAVPNAGHSLHRADYFVPNDDPLHCQKDTARLIAEKGGDYFLQIKGNQPALLACARGQNDGAPFFLSRPPVRTRTS
ncbi:MAG: hypothetical protein HZC54_17580 [Verrucomicrobia bacterium]|nr:hypothetical protein [Verrucomicrobiota bacterium]